jgi:aryl-alcohol dehydrogenase-like predicted oxidoreductase
MHRPDPRTAIEETLEALSDLVRARKVRAVGSSTFPAELIVEAQLAADRTGCTASARSSPATRS